MRKINASKETFYLAKKSPNNKIQVYSFFPIDRATCSCAELIKEWKQKLIPLNEEQRRNAVNKKKFLTCPRDKTNLNRYKISCKACKETLGYCYASDSTLTDWCDFHYVQWTDGITWRGCLTPHISPITEKLCLECCCGKDTRDFRANMTLSPKKVDMIESINKVGREFGSRKSKFSVRKVASNMLPFKKG